MLKIADVFAVEDEDISSRPFGEMILNPTWDDFT